MQLRRHSRPWRFLFSATLLCARAAGGGVVTDSGALLRIYFVCLPNKSSFKTIVAARGGLENRPLRPCRARAGRSHAHRAGEPPRVHRHRRGSPALLRAERGHVPTPARSLSVHFVQRGSVSNGAGHLRAPGWCTESAIHACFWRLPSGTRSQCGTGMAERQRAGPLAGARLTNRLPPH